MRKTYLIFWCAAVAIMAYVFLDFWLSRNAPDFKRFERQWADDVAQLEASPKLPKPWFDVAEVEVFGGTPESKGWLRQIHIPVEAKNPKSGKYKLEVLVVPWDEDGKSGVMVQYNLVELKSKNMIYELGRTLVISDGKTKEPLKTLIQEFKK